MQGIEVGRTTAAIKLKDGDYPAGSLVVKCNQPYGRLAKTLLGKQVDPDPELTTYDDSAWTMGLMTNTTIKPTADVRRPKPHRPSNRAQRTSTGCAIRRSSNEVRPPP